MLFVWILALIAAVVCLKYIYLIIKRLRLIRKISKTSKKLGGNIRYCRNPLTSVFWCDGKNDITISFPNKTIDVSVLTTPFRRVRYHFNNKLLELIVERRAVYLTNPKGRSRASTVDRVYTIWRYKFEAGAVCNDNHKYVILNPTPISISKADGSTIAYLYNNDSLFNGVRVCGQKWFVENAL